MVDVTHDGDHRRARQLLALRGDVFFFEERVRIVQLGGEGLVAHLLDHDHRGLLVELLVDGDHLAQLHQLLDHLGGLDRHLVRQVGDADGLGNVHFLDHHLGGCLEVALALVSLTTAAAARRTPARPVGATTIGAALAGSGALLGRVVSPAGGQLLALDGFLVARLGRRGRGGTRRARHGLGLVDGARDGFLAGNRLHLLGLLGHHHLLRRVHHRADGGSFVLGRLAALGHRGQRGFFGGVGITGLDDAQTWLGRLGRGCRSRCRSRWCSGGRGSRGCRHRRSSDALGWCGGLLDRRGSRSLGGGFNRFTGGSSLRGRFGVCSSLRSGFGRGAFGLLTLGALAGLLGHQRFFTAQLLGLGVGLVLAALQVGLVIGRGHAFGGSRCGHVIALDEDTLLAHLHLDGAGLAGGIGLLDLAGALARQRDLLAVSAVGAMRFAQVLQQAFLVGLGQRVVGRLLRDTGRLQLLEQRPGRTVELGCELGDGRHGHG